MKNVNEITFQETLLVRQAVLRTGKPIETCFFDGDYLLETKHFGIMANQKIIGVVSVFQNKNTNFNNPNQYQIRGMAILNEHQNKGYGKILLMQCETYVSKTKNSLAWFNARQTAIGFYEKLGYKTFGIPFNIQNIGIHYLMFKNL